MCHGGSPLVESAQKRSSSTPRHARPSRLGISCRDSHSPAFCRGEERRAGEASRGRGHRHSRAADVAGGPGASSPRTRPGAWRPRSGTSAGTRKPPPSYRRCWPPGRTTTPPHAMPSPASTAWAPQRTPPSRRSSPRARRPGRPGRATSRRRGPGPVPHTHTGTGRVVRPRTTEPIQRPGQQPSITIRPSGARRSSYHQSMCASIQRSSPAVSPSGGNSRARLRGAVTALP